jgi:excinuclease ABC subunit C
MTPTPPRSFNLKQALAQLPASPGVYRFYDSQGTLLYVGKAKLLKNRVRSYFQAQANHNRKTQLLVSRINHFDTIVTQTEVEALVLEDTLIKQHQPHYNLALKDDKRYPWLALSADAFPRLYVTRRPRRDGSRTRYFGPYPDSRSLWQLLQLLRKTFALRQRPKPLFKDRPCMNYHMKLCPGPCQQLVTASTYDETVKQLVQVLRGHTTELSQRLTQAMTEAAEALNFERAALLRDRLETIRLLEQKQHVLSDDTTFHADAIAVASDGWHACFNVVVVRQGRMIASKPFTVSLTQEAVLAEVYASFIRQYYRQVDDEELPTEVLYQATSFDAPNADNATDADLPLGALVSEDADVLGQWLTQRRLSQPGRRTHVKCLAPQRGHKADVLALAYKNAQLALEQTRLQAATRRKNDPQQALTVLQQRLALPVYPQRMECYDISHFQGVQTVASMVVFINGVPDPSQYRRFIIACAEGEPDDFASMHEVISRRAKHRHDWPTPQLLVIDGGKGQLSAACRALAEQQWADVAIISLAKRYEEIYLPQQSRPVLIDHDEPALFVLQQLRDEAHRFAITFHRQRRAKKSLGVTL